MKSQFGAAGVSRRRVLKTSATMAAVAVTAPWIVRNAFSSSGELRMMVWAGYKYDKMIQDFESKTGIKVTLTEFPDQDKMLAQMKAGGADGAYDIAEPTADRTPNWVEEGVLQPIDESKINLDGVKPAFVAGQVGQYVLVDGKRYANPTVWGTEALMYHKEQVPLTYGEASFADLWREEFKGKVTVRPHSALVGLGLALEGQGKLPKPFRDSFSNPDVMRENYDIIVKLAIENRDKVAQFWSDENSAQGAFRTNGCVIGQNWDTSALGLMKEKFPIGYLAPKEGALAWMQSFVMPKGAKNTEQAYAWMAWFNSAEPNATWANIIGANPTAKGSEDFVSEEAKMLLASAYPGDALDKLWWWPVQPTWFIEKRNEYADKYKSA